MGFVKITKNTKTETIEAEAPTNKTSNNMLDVLNNAAEGYDYDFGRDSAGMEDGRLKKEKSIAYILLTSLLGIGVAIGIMVGIYLFVVEFLGFKLELFATKSFYTDEFFNTELRNCIIILSAALIGICLLLTIFINSTISGRFKKYYLKKLNIYLYDIFVAFINLSLFVIVGVIFFKIINSLYADFTYWLENGIITKNVNIEIMNWFKYGVVIVISLFLSINSLSGIGIVHKKNKFVFEETL